MDVIKKKSTQQTLMKFRHLRKGAPFIARVSLYTRSNGDEDPHDYCFYKLNDKKAVTMDKHTNVLFLPDDVITPIAPKKREEKTTCYHC